MAARADVLATQSSVERLERDGCGVYIKQFHTTGWQQSPEIVRARIEREADILDRLQFAWSGRGNRLGRVRCLEADPAALRMTLAEVPGEMLLDQLVKSSKGRAPAMSVVPAYLAGRWLRTFQELPQAPADSRRLNDDPAEFVDYCDLRLEQLRQQRPSWLSVSQRERVHRVLEKLFALAPEEDRRSVWCHADFYPGNIIWDGHTLTPIDLSMCRLDYPLVDLTYFVHSLYVLQMQFPWRRWPVESWETAILRGFGRPDAARKPMYQAMMIRHVLCKLTGLIRSRAQGLGKIHNLYIAHRARARFSGLTRQAEALLAAAS